MSGSEAFLNDDEELKPVAGLEDDGLLQLDFDELEEEEEEAETGNGKGKAKESATSSPADRRRMNELESELAAMKMAFSDLRSQYMARVGINAQSLEEEGPASSTSRDPLHTSPLAGTSKTSSLLPNGGVRDDDTHYFNSYASNDIHQVMIEDTVRTLSYAKFILSPRNAHIFRGKTIMDVGCGSGILSLFCARAGAKEVLAIDASDVAHRAKKNVEDNGFGHIVKVHKGKIEELGEELKRYEGKVDVIVSEWMGYFLLYECMLPSVLVARDRYLNPSTGLLAPSHCRMLLAAVSDKELLQQRLHFWSDIYGFKMPSMATGLETEVYTEGVGQDKIVTTTAPIFDLPLQAMSAKQPSFVSPFELEVTKTAPIHGFISWFDTWFVPRELTPELPAGGEGPHGADLKGGQVISGLPECVTKPIVETDVEGVRLSEKAALQREPTSSELSQGGETISFTTGPAGKETHWKQAIFLLKEPITEAHLGNIISGEIHVVQSNTNTRELDAEIHWCVRENREEQEKRIKGEIKKVEAKIVQTWLVR